MIMRIIALCIISFILCSCSVNEKTDVTTENERDVLYILPNGTMKYKGRVINNEDVVIYDAARRGERAAIKIILPLHPDAYRDNISVERKVIDVAVERK
jgi:hypothetical protein